MIAVTLDGRVRHEVVQVRVVAEPSRVNDGGRIVDEFPKEPEGFGFQEPRWAEIADLLDEHPVLPLTFPVLRHYC